MSWFSKKILVVLPVTLLGVLYLYSHHDTYTHIRSKRLLFLALTVLVLYGWIFLETAFRKQKSFLHLAIQGGFFVYIFMVLTLTGYFILFREISAHDWWHKMMLRIDRKDHVNFQLFKMFKIYKVFSKQVIGNFIMLLPLGIFLPLLYKKISSLFLVFLTSLLISTTIELLQLVTSYRSADVDDIFLNTLGACTGFVIYKSIASFIKTPAQGTPVVLANK
jgi:glycopeptide antibiotics resistance protein